MDRQKDRQTHWHSIMWIKSNVKGLNIMMFTIVSIVVFQCLVSLSCKCVVMYMLCSFESHCMEGKRKFTLKAHNVPVCLQLSCFVWKYKNVVNIEFFLLFFISAHLGLRRALIT